MQGQKMKVKNAEFAELMKNFDFLQKLLECADKAHAATYKVFKQALDLSSPSDDIITLQFKLQHELVPTIDEIFKILYEIKGEIHIEKYNLDMHISKIIQPPKRSKKC